MMDMFICMFSRCRREGLAGAQRFRVRVLGLRQADYSRWFKKEGSSGEGGEAKKERRKKPNQSSHSHRPLYFHIHIHSFIHYIINELISLINQLISSINE